jgi:hypothetical protein
MRYRRLPAAAAWRHDQVRDGFESVFAYADDSGYRFDGHTAAVEGGTAWAVHYTISVDRTWLTRVVRVTGWSESGHREVVLEGDGAGAWRVDGHAAPELDGCLDIDLESSACTNAFPVHRLQLRIGHAADAPAAFVRALDLSVERLEQRYLRVADDGRESQYDYRAPAFDFDARLVYDDAGMLVSYPGIARRVL